MPKSLPLPDGSYTTSPDEYAAAWAKLTDPITTSLGWEVLSNIAPLTFRTRNSNSIPMSVAGRG